MKGKKSTATVQVDSSTLESINFPSPVECLEVNGLCQLSFRNQDENQKLVASQGEGSLQCDGNDGCCFALK
ncbi:hypothetical protein TNCV_1102881 [Trichonephila clavipes]|nr:hypothetical protein TNCV_1102881 [Trichonephila clavipes]